MHVLIATDGSEYANAAINLLAGLPVQTDRHFFVLTIVPASPLMGVELQPPQASDNRSLLDAAQAIVSDAVSRLAAQGHTTTGIVRLGNPVDEILDSIEEERIDLVVLGAKGVGRVRRFLVGSVATRVADHAHAACSVLIVRSPADHSRVLVVSHGSTATNKAVDLLKDLIGVQTDLPIVIEIDALSDRGVDESRRVVQEAANLGTTLIVVGCSQATSKDPDTMILTAHTLVRDAPCSVLIGR